MERRKPNHTNGLSSTWRRGPIFCSRITAKLFPFKFPNFDFSLLRILDIGSWTSVSLLSPSAGSKTVVQVMAIDAHHCPGALMYLFRGEFGYMLYTGDFRWEITSKRARVGMTMLLNALEGHRLDILYLDNTYCNPSYYFPSRKLAAQKVVDVIAAHPEHDIVIGIDRLGKEDLLVHIAQALKIKIWVWPERLQTMHLLGFHDIFTTKTSSTRVRAVPRYSFSIETLEGLNSMRPTIGIMPSGLPWVVKPHQVNGSRFSSLLSVSPHKGKLLLNGTNPIVIEKLIRNSEFVERSHEYIYSIPYSDHSCFNEIKEFVRLIKPLNVKGIVSSSSCYVDPLYHLAHLFSATKPLHLRKLLPQQLEKFRREERDESMETTKPESMLGSDNWTEAGWKRTMSGNINIPASRLSRVSVIRRSQRGVKIVEDDFPA
ncbi:DNA repair metallo-beta-lactamase [Dillenia turbinata]|uniref:Protein artemis n=1 Tax=Dillenia turbinata TaxID=194707 RepID=A0AAN8YXM3_9MAGN